MKVLPLKLKKILEIQAKFFADLIKVYDSLDNINSRDEQLVWIGNSPFKNDNITYFTQIKLLSNSSDLLNSLISFHSM